MKQTDSIQQILNAISKTTAEVHDLHQALEKFDNWKEDAFSRSFASHLMNLSIFYEEFTLLPDTIEDTGSHDTPSELTGLSNVSSNESMNDAISSMEISTQRSTQSDVTMTDRSNDVEMKRS